jgi:DNA-binding protein YbaB
MNELELKKLNKKLEKLEKEMQNLQAFFEEKDMNYEISQILLAQLKISCLVMKINRENEV